MRTGATKDFYPTDKGLARKYVKVFPATSEMTHLVEDVVVVDEVLADEDGRTDNISVLVAKTEPEEPGLVDEI